jgi:hypothetical protein
MSAGGAPTGIAWKEVTAQLLPPIALSLWKMKSISVRLLKSAPGPLAWCKVREREVDGERGDAGIDIASGLAV